MVEVQADTTAFQRQIEYAAANWPKLFNKAMSSAASGAKRSMAAAGHYKKFRGVSLGFPKRAPITAMLRPGTAPGGVLGAAKFARVARSGDYRRTVAYVGSIGNTALLFQMGAGRGFSDPKNRRYAYLRLIRAGTPKAERDRIRSLVHAAPPNVPPRDYVNAVAKKVDHDWLRDLSKNITRLWLQHYDRGTIPE